jgi:hypothetical protein
VYRRFGEVDAAGTSPLYERVAVALSESGEALRAIEAAPARKRHPTVILAALHDLALAGRAPALAAAYAAADGDAAAGAAIDTLLRMTESVVAIAVRRPMRTSETGRCAVLYPAIAEVGVSGRGRRRADDTDTWRSPRLRPQHHRPGGARPVGPAGRGHRPLLVAGPPAGVASRLLASCQVAPSTEFLETANTGLVAPTSPTAGLGVYLGRYRVTCPLSRDTRLTVRIR